MNNVRLVASRYAEALVDATPSAGELDRVRADLRRLSGWIGKSTELRRALANPVVSTEAKTRVVTEIARRCAAADRTLRFLEVLGQRERLVLLPEIADEIDRQCDARAGIFEAEVSSAVELDVTQRTRLEQALEAIAGGKVRLSQIVDPELLGGVVARIGTTVFDASLKSKLERLRSRLVGQGSARSSG